MSNTSWLRSPSESLARLHCHGQSTSDAHTHANRHEFAGRCCSVVPGIDFALWVSVPGILQINVVISGVQVLCAQSTRTHPKACQDICKRSRQGCSTDAVQNVSFVYAAQRTTQELTIKPQLFLFLRRVPRLLPSEIVAHGFVTLALLQPAHPNSDVEPGPESFKPLPLPCSHQSNGDCERHPASNQTQKRSAADSHALGR